MTRTGYGKSAASSFGPSGSSSSANPRACSSRLRRGPAGSQCTNGSSVCGSIGNHRFGVVTNTFAATRQSSSTKRRWPARPPATCSTTAFEKPRSNSPSANGRSRPSDRTARDGRECGLEPIELGVADGGDPLGPRVERLEEVVARAGPEGCVRDADVDHGCLGTRREGFEEQAQLPLTAPHRHPGGDVPHGTERNGAGGSDPATVVGCEADAARTVEQ